MQLLGLLVDDQLSDWVLLDLFSKLVFQILRCHELHRFSWVSLFFISDKMSVRVDLTLENYIRLFWIQVPITRFRLVVSDRWRLLHETWVPHFRLVCIWRFLRETFFLVFRDGIEYLRLLWALVGAPMVGRYSFKSIASSPWEPVLFGSEAVEILGISLTDQNRLIDEFFNRIQNFLEIPTQVLELPLALPCTFVLLLLLSFEFLLFIHVIEEKICQPVFRLLLCSVFYSILVQFVPGKKFYILKNLGFTPR